MLDVGDVGDDGLLEATRQRVGMVSMADLAEMGMEGQRLERWKRRGEVGGGLREREREREREIGEH